MTILVTGATGLVGNNVTRLLVQRDYEVRVLVREHSDSRPLEGLPLQIAFGDVRNPDAVRQSMVGVAAVIHCAATVHIGWTGLAAQRAVNVDGTRHVAEAALAAGAKMIHVSSVDALGVGTRDQPADEETPRGGKPACSYVVTKTEAEAALAELIGRGLHAPIVNPGFMLGAWDWKPSSGRMLLEVARRFTPVAPTGGMTLCDIRDVVEGILAALERGQSGRNYILGGHLISYFDAWQLFAEVTGGGKPKFRAGPLMRAAGGALGDLHAKLTGKESDLNSAAIKMSGLFHYYRSDRAQAELGYSIRPLRPCVEDAWRWFREHGYVR